VGGVVTRPRGAAVLESIGLRIAAEKCGQLGIRFTEFAGDWTPHFGRATEVLICGSAFGIAGVRRVDGCEYVWPGPVLEALREVWWK